MRMVRHASKMSYHQKCTYCCKKSSNPGVSVPLCYGCYKTGNGKNLFELNAEKIKELGKKVVFLERFCSQFRQETPPDIYLKSGDDQPCLLPAHVIMLAARSEVLKTVVSVDDGLKSAASHETVLTFSELTGEELESLLEFLYTGSLSKEMMDKHAYSLLFAADKYDIPHLLQICEAHIVKSILPGNKRDKLVAKCIKFLRDNLTAPFVLSSHSPKQTLEVLMKSYVSGATGVQL